MIFFTNTMSHKMVQGALSELKGQNTIIERCHASSLSALRGILDKYAVQGAVLMSEELVIRQAAPTLAGIKTGSLFPCPCEDKAALLAEIRAFNRRYQARGLCLLPLRFTKGKALLYLYRPAALQRDLDSDAAAKLLAGAGYPCGSCGGCVAALVRRMRSSAEFPHEVGLFLSYPPEDVKGFIENRAANAKCTGVWKVYGDERQARQTFAKYKKCTQVYCERWQSGSGLDKLAVADR